jgi:hypothetical protein
VERLGFLPAESQLTASALLGSSGSHTLIQFPLSLWGDILRSPQFCQALQIPTVARDHSAKSYGSSASSYACRVEGRSVAQQGWAADSQTSSLCNPLLPSSTALPALGLPQSPLLLPLVPWKAGLRSECELKVPAPCSHQIELWLWP